jgi:hypothetical protein
VAVLLKKWDKNAISSTKLILNFLFFQNPYQKLLMGYPNTGQWQL